MNGQYLYRISTGTAKGAFNIYQGRKGDIFLLMGKNATRLTHNQITDLCIDVYALIDFDHDLFNSFYKPNNA